MQWDWLELGDTPWAAKAYVLAGALSCSGKFRGRFSDSDDQAHFTVGIDEVLRRLGGTVKRWRVDRMATVINPGTGTLQRSFAPVASTWARGGDHEPTERPAAGMCQTSVNGVFDERFTSCPYSRRAGALAPALTCIFVGGGGRI